MSLLICGPQGTITIDGNRPVPLVHHGIIAAIDTATASV